MSEGNPVIVVTTATELDLLIDRVLTETTDHVSPAMIQVALSGMERSPVLELGLGKEKGFIAYISRTEARIIKGDDDPNRLVEYVCSGNVSEIPASAEIPTREVRDGLHHFFLTGKRRRIVEIN